MLHDGYTDQLYALLPVWQSRNYEPGELEFCRFRERTRCAKLDIRRLAIAMAAHNPLAKCRLLVA
jgi:hypothetical protein